MSKLNAAKVVFRRIRGRLVPILKNKDNQKRAAMGGGAGLVVGSSAGAQSANTGNRKDMKKLRKNWKKGAVDSKKWVKKKGFKDVLVITSQDDLSKSKLSDRTKRGLRRITEIAKRGQNAFAGKIEGKNIILTSKKAPKSVLGHELGHIKDYKKHGRAGFWDTGMMGRLTGRQVDREKRAWKLSPTKDKRGKAPALRTYERTRDRTRVGATLGIIGGATLSILSKGRF